MYVYIYIYIYICTYAYTYIYIYKLNPSAPTWNPRFEPRHTADFETRGETTACTSRVYDSGNNNHNNVNTSIIYIYMSIYMCVYIYIYIHTYLQIHIYVVHYEYMALAKFSVFSPLTVLLSRSRPSSNRKCGML